jgi:hypothetical protein
LRSSSTGKSAGFPVAIFGGSHADLPLGDAHGEAIAEVIGTSSTPAIIDTSLMRVGERTRFFADFADTLVRKNKGPLHLVIDEAHLFAPQGKVNDPQSGAMLHAANNLVSLGRSRGLRIMLITQRPAKLHKDSLTQVETLVTLRLIAPQDRKAVEEWIKDNADEAKGREIIQSLATLKTGQGWVWAPEIGVLERVSFPKIKTFDSSRAPEGGDEGKGPVLAPIDKDAVTARLESFAKEIVASDPARLKADNAALRRKVAELEAAKPTVDPNAIAVAEERGFERAKVQLTAAADRRVREETVAFVKQLRERIAPLDTFLDEQIKNAAGMKAEMAKAVQFTPPPAPRPAPVRSAVAVRQHAVAPDGDMPPIVRNILDEIHRANPVALSFEAAALRAGVSRRSSAYRKYRQQVEASAEVERRSDGRFHSAPSFARPVEPGRDPIEAFASRLPPSYAGMLRAIAASPVAMTKEDIAVAAGVSPTSSGLSSGIRELIALSLIEKQEGDVYTIHHELAA